ncbi:ectoine hydroxylase [Mycolicibacterium chubuense NBB4]|uniref:Ectoine hydroxylase n=1 Tax=Mycolicibacterium chubuense (strain NBB4) TaxID=710421 RepID=I4BIJ9_MYCCN|nr:ectoine hydroxylase [Mycolicibacterium chubuense]AFM17106.1 ectoine hydroxylase [Mycolicibacterium chubuense NBB4]
MSLDGADRCHDHYPTRVAQAAEPIARIEPVVWGSEQDGPLDDHELRTVADTGYLVRPGTLEPNWLQPLREELQHLGSRAAQDDPRIIREPSGGLRSVFEPHRLSDLIAEVVTVDTVLPVARQLLGSEVYIHQARLNLMPGFRGSGFYWHSDFETWHAEDGMPSMRAVSCSIALTENYPYNGALMVMPGSHQTFYPCVGATPHNHHEASLVRQEIGVPDEATLTTAAHRHGIEQVTGPAGTALWFDSNMMHGSASNITPFPRSNIFLVFNSVENRLCEPFASAAPRPEYLAARTPQLAESSFVS